MHLRYFTPGNTSYRKRKFILETPPQPIAGDPLRLKSASSYTGEDSGLSDILSQDLMKSTVTRLSTQRILYYYQDYCSNRRRKIAYTFCPTPVMSMYRGAGKPKNDNDSVWVTYERFVRALLLLSEGASTKGI